MDFSIVKYLQVKTGRFHRINLCEPCRAPHLGNVALWLHEYAESSGAAFRCGWRGVRRVIRIGSGDGCAILERHPAPIRCRMGAGDAFFDYSHFSLRSPAACRTCVRLRSPRIGASLVNSCSRTTWSQSPRGVNPAPRSCRPRARFLSGMTVSNRHLSINIQIHLYLKLSNP